MNLLVYFFVFLSIQTVSLALLFNKSSKVQSLKSDILTLSRRIDRGLTETGEDRQKMQKLFEDLERQNKKS